MDVVTNGAAAPGVSLDVIDAREHTGVDAYLEASRRTRDRIVEELSDLRDSEQLLVDELTRQAGEARARHANYQRALDALGARGKAKPKAAAAKKAPKGAAQGMGGANNWQISDDRVKAIEARVHALLPSSPHKVGDVPTITAGWIADNTDGVTPETARRGLNVLRDREVLRVAGTGKGGGVLFALMPEGTHDD